MPRFETLLWPLLVVCAAGMLVTGCPHPPNPGPAPANSSVADASAPMVPACPLSVVVTPEDVCDGLFTADGHACAVCKGGRGCIDTVDQIYCAAGPCLGDPACKVITGSPPAGGAMCMRQRLGTEPTTAACAL